MSRKRFEIALVFFMVALGIVLNNNLQAQDLSLWNNIRNSSYTFDEQIHVRSEILTTTDSAGEFYYFQNERWSASALTNLEGATYETVFPVDPDQLIYCRYRTIIAGDLVDFPEIIPGLSDSLVIMMPGYLPSYPTPLNLDVLAKVAHDPEGDVDDSIPPYLDLTGHYFSYSDTHIHTAITNNDNHFPTGSILGPYNFYANLIINPENAAQDTVFYGMVYTNVFNVITPGLYRFSGVDIEAMGRIGNISHSTTDNTLFMSASWEDLTTDQYFGEWPSISNTLIVIPVTLRIDRNMEFTIADVGKISAQVFKNYVIETFDNTLPQLSELQIERMGPYTQVSIDYFDHEGHFPIISRLVFEDQSEVDFSPTRYNYQRPVRFEAMFPANDSEGIIQFSDNGYDMVEYPFKVSAARDELREDRSKISVYPNPVSFSEGGSSINIEMIATSSESNFKVYNIKGQVVRRLGSDFGDRHQFRAVWDGRNASGKLVKPGIYFVTMQGEYRKEVKKMIVFP